MPRIGVISGATIIAPITVAVESVTTPAVAITAANSSNAQNRLSLRARSGPSNRSASRIRARSVAAIAGIRLRASGTGSASATGENTLSQRRAELPAPGPRLPIDRPGGCNPRTPFDTEVWPTLTPITRQPGHDIFQIVGGRQLLRFEPVALATRCRAAGSADRARDEQLELGIKTIDEAEVPVNPPEHLEAGAVMRELGADLGFAKSPRW